MNNKKIALILSLLIQITLFAQTPGTFDQSFGQAGLIDVDGAGVILPGSGGSFINYAYDQVQQIWYHEAYKENGEIDSTYGINGRFVPYPGGMVSDLSNGMKTVVLSGMVNQPDNFSDATFQLLKEDYSIDSTFGQNGIVQLHISNYDRAYRISVLPDGSYVMLGETTGSLSGNFDEDIFLAKFTPGGDPDLSFGINGWRKLNLTPFSPHQIAIEMFTFPDGKILIGGWAGELGTFRHIFLTRFNSDGTEDATFGTGGYVYTEAGNSSMMKAMRLLPDGKMIVAASSDFSQTAIVRYLQNGTRDNSFSGDGIMFIPGLLTDALAIQQDNKVLVCGPEYTIDQESSFVVRVKENGTMDNTFSGDGKMVINFTPGDIDRVYEIEVLSNGKILIIGSKDNSNEKIYIARIHSGLLVAVNEPQSSSYTSATAMPSVITDQQKIRIAYPHKGAIDRDAVIADASGRIQLVTVEDAGDYVVANIPPQLSGGVHYLLFSTADNSIVRASFVKAGN
jgi:uncharacterized delta-60 repeat protein